MATRPCSRCTRNRDERFFTSPRGKVCRDCRKKATRRASRNTRLTNTYGISQDEYEQQLHKQGGVCAICGGTRRTNLHVDHDHALEKAGLPMRQTLRGLLCASDNKLLAVVRDNPERLRKAAAYLESGGVWESCDASG